MPTGRRRKDWTLAYGLDELEKMSIPTTEARPKPETNRYLYEHHRELYEEYKEKLCGECKSWEDVVGVIQEKIEETWDQPFAEVEDMLIGLAALYALFGVYVDVGFSYDWKGNVSTQWSYAVPGVNDTASVGFLDAGIGGCAFTNAEDVDGLLGPSSAIGASGGYLGYVTLDLISFEDISDMNGDVDGFQIGGGLGADMVWSVIMWVVATIIALLICIILILLIRNNANKVKLKRKYGEVVQAKVISWDVVPGKPTRYIIKVEFEKDEKKENKILVTSGRFAKKYEHERNVQIVIVPNSKKVFFEEEDWNSENIVLFLFLIISLSFLILFLLTILIFLCEG